ncbi:MAG TPA: serine/threonine-protein kinase [Kofleriaceae bacterium]|nr:serine/threonine-protein kinase [Kofleriaceae bacterium]
MESDKTAPRVADGPHPTMAELSDRNNPTTAAHIASCAMCRSLVGEVALDLPKGLVSEAAFVWPAEPMAEGGMAQIFAADDRRLKRTVILKTPREGENLTPALMRMFQRRIATEAAILAKLQHPSIVTIYELGKASTGWPFCVMERVEGRSLRDRLDELAVDEAADGKPKTRERLELIASLVSIAEAMAYAHERRVVHRDITPNNILLGTRNEATLIDWGIARDLDVEGSADAALLGEEPPSASGRMVTISAGTPPYLSLEQSQGRAAAPGFDVYSFGVILYEVISGRTPFTWKLDLNAAERSKQLNKFLDWLNGKEPVAPAMARDPELSGIIAKAMHRDPAQRFSADELVLALKQYLTGDLVFSHRYSPTGRMAQWVRKHRVASVMMVFVAAAAVAGALVWAQLSRQAQAQAELRLVAAAARADASEKSSAADAATREAEAAKQRAEQAEREGKDAASMRVIAEQKRKAAEAMRADAEAAATQAKGTADDALAKFREAMKQKADADAARDAALAAQAAAEASRDAAKQAQAVAERDRDNAASARAAAEQAREAAKAGQATAEAAAEASRQAQTRAEADRESARAGQVSAERDRDAAVAGRAGVERERDQARADAQRAENELNTALRRIATLEAQLRGAPPPIPTPNPTP